MNFEDLKEKLKDEQFELESKGFVQWAKDNRTIVAGVIIAVIVVLVVVL